MKSDKRYSVHQDLDYVSISKWVSYEKGWERIESLHINDLIKKLGLETK